MADMETLSEAITRLTGSGYVENFHPVAGHLVCGRCETDFDPSDMSVDEVVRFEGASNPDDQAILYALDAGCGHRGLYAAAYGTAASSEDTAVLLALPDL